MPFGLVPARWSLSYPGANFGAATVTMAQGATSIPTTVISRTDNGYGDNTLVWVPSGLPTAGADVPYNVTVAAISGSGVPVSYTYTVTLFDPNVLNDSPTIAGTSTPPTTGAAYTYNSIAQADAYELRVTTASAAAWTEGAEDPSTQIAAATTGSYALRQTAVKRTGTKAFQLAFPDFTDQSLSEGPAQCRDPLVFLWGRENRDGTIRRHRLCGVGDGAISSGDRRTDRRP